MRYFEQFKSGSVNYSCTKMPDCCGIAVIHNVKFYARGRMDALHKEFHSFLTTDRNAPFDARRSVLMIMTDRGGGQIYRFCKAMKWEEEKKFKNAKTGNSVSIFTQGRGKKYC